MKKLLKFSTPTNVKHFPSSDNYEAPTEYESELHFSKPLLKKLVHFKA